MTGNKIYIRISSAGKMMLLLTFLGAICAAAAFPQSFTSRSCFERLEMECMENFVDSVFFSERGVDECSELREFVDCSANAADHCFTLQRSREIDRGLTMFDNLYEDFCSAVYSGDDSDFDEETYSHIKLSATVRRRKKKVSPSTTDKGASEKDESSDPRNCFNERKRSCWETFEDDIIDSIFYIDIHTDGDIDTDECRALESFVQCIKEADVDCFEDRHNRDVVDILEVWENKKKMFCGPATPNYSPTENKIETVTPPITPKFSSDESSNSKTCFQPRKAFCWDAFAAKFSGDAPFSIDKLTGIFECTDLQSFIHCIRKAADDCFEDDYDREAVQILEKLKKNYKMFCAFIAANTEDPSGFQNSIFYPTPPANSEFSVRLLKEFINFAGSNCSENHFPVCLSTLDFDHRRWRDCRNDVKRLIDCLRENIDNCYGEDLNEIIEDRYKDVKTSLENDFCEDDSNDKEIGKEESISKLMDNAKTRDPVHVIPNPHYLSII